MDWKAANTGYKYLSEDIFPNYSVGYIHGKMKKNERDSQMSAVEKNEIQCLVATTVIEVGIDIPNATIMIIENAEKFGLTQLHQLRGRIGRGPVQSYCILVKNNHTPDANKRLKIIESSSNGFNISDEDLKLRGPGEFFGTRQHGYIRSKIVNLSEDGPIIRQTRKRAFQIVKIDPVLKMKAHQSIRKQFKENYRHMLEFLNIG